MKKFFVMAAMAASVLAFTSCDNDDANDSSAKDAEFKEIAADFLTNTVYPTYKSLADYTEELEEALSTAAASKTDANVAAAAKVFLQAREQWEKSEAFLFGAATDFGIDPHIDSWPLDEDAFNNLMASPEMLKNLEGEDGAVYAGENLGNALLGFHGIEYILFEDGEAKSASEITDNEFIYAVAVSGDLKNRTAQLDAAWRGEAAGDRLTYVEEELELNTTVAGGDLYYGENLLASGEAGSTFRSWTHAMQSILQSSADIADEVGTSKIGKAHTGEDESYIESPYSYNSITDFYDNITSVENVYYGGRTSSERNSASSLHAYFAKNDADTDDAISSAIEAALTAINAMDYPFVKNYSKTNTKCDAAMEACAALVEVLEAAETTIAQ